MRRLLTILAVGGCLSFWAGAVSADPSVNLKCSETKCQYSEEVGPDVTHYYYGYCDGAGNTQVTGSNSNMVCHKAKHLTCTKASFDPSGSPVYWQCVCTNWNPSKEAHADIDLTCPAPS